MTRSRHPGSRYAWAVAVAALAVVARRLLDPYLGGRAPYILNFSVVAAAAWFGGLGPGLVTLALSAASSVALFYPPARPFSTSRPSDVFNLALFLLNGVIIAMICEAQRVAQRRAEASAVAAVRALGAEQAQREQLRTTLDGIGDGVIVADAEGHVTLVNPAAERLTGWTSAGADGLPLERVFRLVDEETGRPVDGPAPVALREGRGAPTADRAVLVTGDGAERLIDGSAAPVRGDDGTNRGVVVTFRDVTDRRHADDALRQSERLFRILAESIPQIVWVSDPGGKVEYLNGRWFEYTGMSPEASFTPGGTLGAIHPDDLAAVSEAARASADGEPFEAEFRLRDRTGRYRWQLGRSVVVRDDGGRDVRRFGTTTDIDDRKRAEHDARFLAEASASLATLAGEEEALRHLADLAVPFFADWCVVDVAAEGGAIRRLAVAHADPAKVALAAEVARRFPPDPDAPRGIPRVLRTGRTSLVPEVTDEMLAAAARGEEHLEVLRTVGVRSFLSVPLSGRVGTLGVITFLSAESGRRFGPNDLRLAEDLGHRAAIAVENIRLTDALKAADRKKDEFLATLAHELLNPLAPIRNALYLMGRQAGGEPASARELGLLDRQVGHLARLVDDLLDVSRIREGKIELRREPLDLTSVARQAVETTRPLFAEKGHELVVTLPTSPVPLEADPTRLEQVLWNLLNNAAKYTEPGGRVELTVAVEGDKAVVSVRDNGIGITAEVLPHVFELFVQADHRGGRARGGLGIGLSLVRELVRMHGGRIRARSDGLGFGSEFSVRLPLDRTGAVAPAPPAAGGVDRGGPPTRRVLVVDDNVDAAQSLGRLLTRVFGQQVRVAHDGPGAVAAVREFGPEVVLLDIGLPGMDGYEVARQIRSGPGGAGVLVVAVTGWGQDADRERSRDAGIDRHLVKPVDPEVLRGILSGHAESPDHRPPPGPGRAPPTAGRDR